MIQDIPETQDLGGEAAVLGSISDIKTAAILTLGTSFEDRFHIGINAKGYYNKISDQQGTGFGLDIGGIADLDYVTLGAAVHHVGETKITWDSGHTDIYAPELHLGASTSMIPYCELFSDAQLKKDRDAVLSIGISSMVMDTLKIQGGLHDINGLKRLSLGTTLLLDDTELNYTFAQTNTMGMIHKFGVSMTF